MTRMAGKVAAVVGGANGIGLATARMLAEEGASVILTGAGCTRLRLRLRDKDGYGPWTVKSGLIQVEPPFDILERMVTLRVHLDAVDERNAPLRIVPGSHRLGRVPETETGRVVTTFGERLCLAERGDVWLYATSIVHASLAADPPRRRRVLQVDFSADATPGPLAWQGV